MFRDSRPRQCACRLATPDRRDEPAAISRLSFAAAGTHTLGKYSYGTLARELRRHERQKGLLKRCPGSCLSSRRAEPGNSAQRECTARWLTSVLPLRMQASQLNQATVGVTRPALSSRRALSGVAVPLRAQQQTRSRASVVSRAAPKTLTMAAAVAVKEVPTTPIEGQKTGTSGLRKKAKEFSSGNYLANWVQSLFNALPKEDLVR